MAKEMGLDRAPIEFQTFYFSHVLVVSPNRNYDDDDDLSWISLSPAPVLPTRKFLSELLGRAHLFWNVNDSLTAGEEFYKSGTMLINT